MNSTKKAARRAGLLYVVMSIPAPFIFFYIPSLLIVPGDATATASKIRASELLFRVGMAGELIGATGFIFVALALYRLLKGVDKAQAALMVMLWVLSVPISFLNVLSEMATLTLLSRPNFLSVFDPRQLDAVAMAFLNFHDSGLLLVQVFWGLWLFPFGVLVYKSGFLPRILGVLLMPAGLAYLAVTFTNLLFPHYGDVVSKVATVLQFGELPIMLWLVIVGAKDQPLDAAA